MIRSVNKTGTGEINFDEFMELMIKLHHEDGEEDEELTEEAMMTACKAIDVDGDGVISFSEFKEALYSLGHCLSDKEIKALMKDGDMDGDGTIDYSEFARLMKELC